MFLCSYRRKDGRVCKTESYAQRCGNHTDSKTNILCINCDSRFTNNSVSICNSTECSAVYATYRAQVRNHQKYYNAAFAKECIERIEKIDADMTA